MQRALAVLLVLSLLGGGPVGTVGVLLITPSAQLRPRPPTTRRAVQDDESARREDEAPIEHLVLARPDGNPSSPSWTRIDEHEVRYRGKLYDIVRAEQRGNTWHVWARHDREEERYLRVLAHTWAPMLHAEWVSSSQRRPQADPQLTHHLPAPPGPSPGQPASRRVFSSKKPEAPYLKVPHPPPWRLNRTSWDLHRRRSL